MTKCKVIALANQKGGTAKTTTTLNLGIGLAQQGQKVLLVDVDPQGDLTNCIRVDMMQTVFRLHWQHRCRRFYKMNHLCTMKAFCITKRA